MKAILHGFILAFGLILPLGAQNIFLLCQGAFQPRLRRAVPGILTASLCDTLLIVVAVSGMAAVIAANTAVGSSITAVGCILLLYLGWQSWIKGDEALAQVGALSPRRQILLAAGVSLGNPHAIFDTLGVIGVASLQYEGSDKLLFAASCIGVSWFWFFALAAAGRAFGSRFLLGRTWFSKLAALFIWTAALYLGWHLASGLL